MSLGPKALWEDTEEAASSVRYTRLCVWFGLFALFTLFVGSTCHHAEHSTAQGECTVQEDIGERVDVFV